ncbi:MAG: DUF1289 domain-containing protein [Aestuariibacter sp.]
MITESKITSPCIRNCCLDDKDICVGCFRHISEITSWTTVTEQQRAEILARCKKRSENHKLQFSE